MDQQSPAVGKTIMAGGVRTNYLDTGTGQPVLLLHGSGVGVSSPMLSGSWKTRTSR